MDAMDEQARLCIALPLKKGTQKEDVKDMFPQHQHTLAEQWVSRCAGSNNAFHRPCRAFVMFLTLKAHTQKEPLKDISDVGKANLSISNADSEYTCRAMCEQVRRFQQCLPSTDALSCTRASAMLAQLPIENYTEVLSTCFLKTSLCRARSCSL